MNTPHAAPAPTEPDAEERQEEHAEPDGEASGPRRALAVPDLRPYADPRPLADLGPLAIQAGKAGLPLVRAAGVVTALVILFISRGVLLLLRVTAAWLSGKVGTRGSGGARLAVTGLVLYAVIHASSVYPAAPVLVGLVVGVLAAAAAAGILPLPKAKPEKGAKGKGAKGAKGARGKGAKADTEEETTEEETTEKDAAPARDGLRARLARRLTAAGAPADAPETGLAAGADQAAVGAPAQAPAEDPLTAIIRAEIGGENGVHLCDLRPAMRAALPGLAGATDGELRDHLLAAGWDPSRKFRARGVAGRAGVHRSQLPPLPSPGGAPGGRADHSPPPGEWSRPAHSSPGGEGWRGGGEWSEEDRRRGHRIIRDLERGPTAWKIQHHRK